MKSAVVLLSGGLDSTTLLHHVIKNLGYEKVYALSVFYGQKHDKELQMAQWQCDQLNEVKQLDLFELPSFANLIEGASALTAGGQEVPDLDSLGDSERTQPPTYVPNRNMMMLSIAAAYAEAKFCKEIFYGAQAQDEYGYWDCTTDFITHINQVLSLNRKNEIEIVAPFVNMKKSEELAIGIKLGVNYAKTWTCYRGGEKACGVCPTCVERLTAFKELNQIDPLDYE
ncbi:MAG: 7-cyano-7-deazaguanine synthase QueC [Lentisphaeria bacterium]|nr:7-cyano-7-deazaguanine synthase QueC [Lentisphaeria bacterium]